MAVQEPTWRALEFEAPAYIGTGDRSALSVTLCGQSLWLMGGLEDGYAVPTALYKLDLVTKAWSKFDFPQKLVHGKKFGIYAHTATLANSRILFIGGFFGVEAAQPTLGVVFGFDLVLKEFDVVETYGLHNRGRVGHHSASFMDETSEIVVYGGKAARDAWLQDPLYTLNTHSLTWTRLRWQGKAPSQRGNHGSCLVEQRLYIFGGYGPNNDFFDDTFILDMRFRPPVFSQPDLSWVPRKRLGTYLFHHRGNIFMFGGKAELDIHMRDMSVRLNELCRFSIAEQKWYQCPKVCIDPDLGKKANHNGVVVNNRVLIFGGKNGSFRKCLEMMFD